MARARCVIERAYALLKGRWRRLLQVNASVEVIPTLIVACCVLHNICIAEEEEVEDFILRGVEDGDGDDEVEAILPPQPGAAQLQQYLLGVIEHLP